MKQECDNPYCKKQAELYHNDHMGLALCEACDATVNWAIDGEPQTSPVMYGRWTVLTSDTDCDGTSFQAHAVDCAASEDDAVAQFRIARSYDYHIIKAIPEDDFIASEQFKALDDFNQGYYMGRGYITLGNTWS